VIYYIAALDSRVDFLRSEEIPFQKIEARGFDQSINVGECASAEVVKCADFIPSPHEKIYKMAPDEAGSSSHENGHKLISI